MPSLTPTFTRRSRLCCGNRVFLQQSFPSECPTALGGCMKREQRQLFGSCLTCFRSHTTKSSHSCCRCCFCPRKKKINNTQHHKSRAMFVFMLRSNAGGGCLQRERKYIIPMQFPLFFPCTDVISSQFPSRSRGLGACSNWNARLIKVEVEDGTGQAKSLIAQLIKLLSCCIGLFSICVLQLCDFLSFFFSLRSP